MRHEKQILALGLSSFALLGSGCSTPSAELVQQRYEPVRSGVVQYERNTANWVTRRNRREAEEIATDFCDGKFKIISEQSGSRIDGYTSFAPSNYVVSTSANRTDTTSISFRCLANRKAIDDIILE